MAAAPARRPRRGGRRVVRRRPASVATQRVPAAHHGGGVVVRGSAGARGGAAVHRLEGDPLPVGPQDRQALAVVGLISRRAGVLAPLRALAIRLVPGALAALSVAWSTWLLGGRHLDLAATGFTRVLLIVLPSAVLLPFIDTDRLGDHLAQRLHLPDRPVVAVSAALHRMQSFAQIWEEISRARRVRGLGVSWRQPATILRHVVALTVGLLVRALRAAADLAVAMDARGFATAQRRTWWAPATWRWSDTVLVLLAAVPTGLAVLAAARGW